MAARPVNEWRLIIPAGMYQSLHDHLFPGDRDEHGAIMLAGVAESDRGLRLIGRELYLATDGVDYTPGRHGYRMLKAEYIQRHVLRARDQGLAYLAIHNHGGSHQVSFSKDDMASHERGYPALLDITRGCLVGALVFARNAVAGDLWFPDRRRAVLDHAAIVGATRRQLFPARRNGAGKADETYDRQVRLFGERGQSILRKTRVGIIGLGGAGSVLAELLGRLGVGEFVLADPDFVETSNLPRLIGATLRDTGARPSLPRWLQKRLATAKVTLARRNIRRANPAARVTACQEDFLHESVAKRFTDCDYLFLAADTMSARLLFNAIVHQYGIPGVQVGAKVPADKKSGEVGDVFCVSRTVTPDEGCLLCNGLINASRLQAELVPASAKRGFAYIDEPDLGAPSVVTLNAIACAHAADEFLFHIVGLKYDTADGGWFRWNSRRNQAGRDMPRKDPQCPECSQTDFSRLGRGDGSLLPVQPG